MAIKHRPIPSSKMKKCPLCQREIEDEEVQKIVRATLEILGEAIAFGLTRRKK